MSVSGSIAEKFAKVFYRYHEALAPDFNCAVRSRESWDDVPANERSRLVAAARLALLDLASVSEARNDRESYFANPGEAEWGC